MPPRYEATVRLLVGRVGGASGFQADLSTDQQLAKTYAELAVTRSVLQQVLGTLQLRMDSATLAQHVKVKLMPDTRLMDVTVDDPDADQAAAVATAIGNQLVSLGEAGATDVGTSIQRSLLDDLDSLSADLRRDQADLHNLETSLAAAGTADPELITRRDKLRSDVLEERRTRAGLYDVLLRTAPSSGAVRLVSPAIAPLAPTNPSLAQAAGVSALLGVLLALVVVLVLDVFERRVGHPSRLPLDDALPYLGSH
jgi:capsular polysaccharide biosynthesis protein